MSDSVIVARPAGPPMQLMLLFHGVGSTALDLVPLGRVLAREFPDAFIVSVAAPAPSEAGGGRQWFSVLDISEENRPRASRRPCPPSSRPWRLAEGGRRRHRRRGADRLLAGRDHGARGHARPARHRRPRDLDRRPLRATARRAQPGNHAAHVPRQARPGDPVRLHRGGRAAPGQHRRRRHRRRHPARRPPGQRRASPT